MMHSTGDRSGHLSTRWHTGKKYAANTMKAILEAKWQWMDNAFGPMGWFSESEKAKHENTPAFSDGHWRAISHTEVANMALVIGRLAYEQS